ncbi:hypothetical protein ACSVHC_05345 [Arthrobacter sp. KNU-44]|uniref:hypothetical protein n=1 Tax=unclassified Arthrobacter TaxID=235627 RepID=UPI003F42D0F7
MNWHQLAARRLPWGVGDGVMKLLTLFPAVLLLIVATIAFFNNQTIMGILSVAASGANLATWPVYKKQTKQVGRVEPN